VGNRIPSVQRNVNGPAPSELGGPKASPPSSEGAAPVIVDTKEVSKDVGKGDSLSEGKDKGKDEDGDAGKDGSNDYIKDNRQDAPEEDSKDIAEDDASATQPDQSAVQPSLESTVQPSLEVDNLVPSTLPHGDDSTGTPVSTVTEATDTAPSLSLDSEDLRVPDDLKVSGITRTTSSLSIDQPSAVHSSMYVESDTSSRQQMQDVSGVSTPTGTPKIVRKGLDDDRAASQAGDGSDDGEESRRDDETPGVEQRNIVNLGDDKLDLQDSTVELNASGDVEDLVHSKTESKDVD